MTTARAASPLLIGGEHIADTDDVIVSIDPATGQPNHEVCAADARHVDAAVAAARDAAANLASQEALRRDIGARGYVCIAGVGEDPDRQWNGEDSVLVPAVGLAEAMLIADSYRQNALVWAGPDARAQLILLR